jgi:alpha-tubulin suppressor-like RCC1 family protein
VAAGEASTCAITSEAQIRCWGRNTQGQLGYGDTQAIGDTEPPSDAGDVSLYPASLPAGASVAQLALGKEHSCAMFSTGEVLCWGKNSDGQLGQGNNQAWGNQADEFPSALEPISLGAAATQIAAGLEHTCALLTTGEVLCWGKNDKGQLGQGDPDLDDVGVDQLPSEVPVVDLGGDAVAVTAGGEHTCALLENRRIVCWGFNTDGRLGYGHTNQIGDNEPPSDAGFLEIL